MNDAVTAISPARNHETVGNSTQVGSSEKPATFAYGLMGSTFLPKTLQREEGSLKTPPTPQISPYISVWGSAFLLSNYREYVGVSASSTYGWDYKNRLASTSVSGNVTTFGYDNGMNRVWKYNSSVGTTTYASRYFVVASSTTGTATTTKNIYTPDGELIAYIETVGATSTRQYVHNDHLGSVSATTDSNGDTTSVRDYLPFGSERINETYGTASRLSFIGREKDSGGENYLVNRYYNSDRGQFLSIDPVFYELGITSDGKKALLDPQLQNSYVYARGNPISLKDPDGRFIPQAIALGALYGGVTNVAFQAYSDYQSGTAFNIGTYASSFGKGATVGAAAVYGAIPAAVASIGYSLTANYFGGGVTVDNTINAFTEGAVTGLTAGFLKGLPGVPGRQASKVLGGYYFGGAHGVRYGQEAAFGLGSSIYFNNVQGITNQFIQSTSQQSASLSSSQSSALSGVIGAFAPSNSQQASAVQRVISAFSQKRRRKQYNDSNDDEVDDSEPSGKYTTNWMGTITVFATLAIFNAIVFYLNRDPGVPLSKVAIGLVSWFVFVGLGVLLMTVYSYASVSDTTLKFVWLFFSRRTIDINSITEINDQSTYKVAKGQFRSLYVFYKDKNGDIKWIEFRITIFPEKTLGKLIKDLKQINPNIVLNKYSQKLMESAST